MRLHQATKDGAEQEMLHTNIGDMRNGYEPKVVVIGGGSGSSNVLKGLKRFTPNLTAIVTMFDSGGSSGVLREEFGFPAFGDLRQCLLALGDDTQETRTIRAALSFRFGNDTSLNGHSVGNLMLAALTSLDDDLEQAVAEISRILRVDGDVIPVTLERAELCAELADNTIITGESNIDLRFSATPSIKRIFLNAEVNANPRAIQAIRRADLVVLGPGDLYTSVLPNLLANGITDALASTDATRIYVCNLMTKFGETDGFKASDFVREMLSYLGTESLDWVIINTKMPSTTVLTKYEQERASTVEPDSNLVSKYVNGTIATSLAHNELPIRHDPVRTASAIFQAAQAGRVAQTPNNLTYLPANRNIRA